MRYRFVAVLSLALACTLTAGPARAQDAEVVPDGVEQPAAPPPPHIEFIDGVVTVEHQGQSDRATLSQPLIAGDRIKTENGRVEVMFADGSFLYLDHFTSIEFLDIAFVRMTAGRATLIVKGQGDTNTASAQYQIDTPAASVRADVPGEYRVATLNGRATPETELAVVRGAAQIATDAGAMVVRAGERSTAADGRAPSMPYAFNAARFDAFDRWTAGRQDAWLGSTSTRYLPEDVQMYAGAFDRYGTWGYDAQYGNVWYPTVVPSWRPYFNGYWSYYPQTYGWFWIGADAWWGWPTHHYGRWGFGRNRWFWIPGRRWGAAWVSWAISPTYVSWCPLGFDGRPVFAFFGARSVGVGVGYNPWTAWTLVPRHSFGSRVYASVLHVDGRRLGSIQRTGFVVQQRGPERPTFSRAYAVPRGATGPRSPAGAAATFNRRFDRPATDPRAGGSPGRVLSYGDQRRAVVGSAVPRGAPTRIEPEARVPYGYVSGYSRSSESGESPYERAARVARERQPGPGRQPLGGVRSYESPYPPQYRSPVPEPYRPQSQGSGPVPYDRAVPRGPGAYDARRTPAAPNVSRPSYTAPQAAGPMTAQPRRAVPDGPRGGGFAVPRGGSFNRGPLAAPQAAPPPSRGGFDRGPMAVPQGAPAPSRGGFSRTPAPAPQGAPSPSRGGERAAPRQGGRGR